MEITSVNNELVKQTVRLQQKKYRLESGLFLLEGYKSVYEAVKYGINLERVFVLADKKEKYSFIKDNIIETNLAVLKKISTTESAPEVVAVGVQPENDVSSLMGENKVILLENISDAGNLGTIIRSAAAFNIDAIVLYGNTVDLYNPKCVRSAVGNLWKTAIVHIDSIEQLNKYFKNHERYATLPETKESIMYNDWTPDGQILVMFGSEADGLSDELIDYANKNLTIEMNNDVESLNLSVSAGLVMHKIGFWQKTAGQL